MKTRIMYIENKADGLNGPARIGRVTLSKSGRTYYYRGRMFSKTKSGFKANCFDSRPARSSGFPGARETAATGFTVGRSKSTRTFARNTGL